jgi:hypothetical protein
VTHRRHGAAQGPASHLTARKGSDPTASPTASVIICAYTERRWDDLVESVRVMGDSGDDAPFEIIVVIDHNPGLAARVRPAATWWSSSTTMPCLPLAGSPTYLPPTRTRR